MIFGFSVIDKTVIYKYTIKGGLSLQVLHHMPIHFLAIGPGGNVCVYVSLRVTEDKYFEFFLTATSMYAMELEKIFAVIWFTVDSLT